MPHIQLPPDLPGVTGAFAFSLETVKRMRGQAGERLAHQGYVPQPEPATAD